MKPTRIVAALLLLISIALHGQESTKVPSTGAASPIRAKTYAVRPQLMFRIFFQDVARLDELSLTFENQGRNGPGQTFRTLVQRSAELADKEAVLMKKIAYSCTKALKGQDEKARRIIDEFPAQDPNGKDLREAPLAELALLDIESDRIIDSHAEQLRESLTPAAFERIERYAKELQRPVTASGPLTTWFRVSQNVLEGFILDKPMPPYPDAARRNKVHGLVTLHVLISRAGELWAAEVVGGDPLLGQAALDGVRYWKFKPYLLNGLPVDVESQIAIDFRLPKNNEPF